MPLVRPLIVGPISTLSRAIRVRGQLAGATVIVVSLGATRRTVAMDTADSADFRIPIDPAETLKPDDLLYAIQQIDGDSSPEPQIGDPLGIPVQPAPTTTAALGSVTVSSILYTCGHRVRLRGGVPGAVGQILSGNTIVGSGTFHDEAGARIDVAPALFGTIKARQSIPGVGDGPALSRTSRDLPGASASPLPAPDIDPAPVACNTAVRITQVFDGARVILRRDDGQQAVDLHFTFDAPQLWARVGAPLKEGESLTVSQAVHEECSRPQTTRDITVGQASPVAKPVVAGPLCVGSSLIHIDGLIAGAGLEVMANGLTYRAQVPPAATSLDVIVDPLEAPPPGHVRNVTARQEQCGEFGPDSEVEPVQPVPDSVPQHEIAEPLLACSPIVRVTNVHPRALLMAFSDVIGSISGYVTAGADGSATIEVAPLLETGQTIEVRQWACGGDPVSAFRPVSFVETVPVPTLSKPFIGRDNVDIDGLTLGATVEVMVAAQDGTIKEISLLVADDKTLKAPLQAALAPGDKVKARQGLCQSLSGFSSEQTATVEPILPDWWQWTGANPRNEAWKEDFVVSGTFKNKGGTPIEDCEIAFFEDAANPGSTSHSLVSPGQSVPGATDTINKDWQWFVPGICFVKGPTHKIFNYRAVISGTDVAGSPYPETSSPNLMVFVNVSKVKRTAGTYSMATAASAAAMAASVILIVAAGVAYGLAVVAGEVASDPPEPDPDFRRQVALPPLGEVPATGPDRTLIRAMRLGERVMRIELAKSLIEGRRLGALSAEDADWIEIHTRDLAAATALQQALVNEARSLAPQAKQEVLTLVPPGTDLRPRREQLQATGLTLALADQMHLPVELRAGFDALLRSDAALPQPDIIAAFDQSIEALVAFADGLG
jgi:hypothetical protein